LGQEQREPDYWLFAHRHTGSMTSIQALKGNMGDPEKKWEKKYFTDSGSRTKP